MSTIDNNKTTKLGVFLLGFAALASAHQQKRPSGPSIHQLGRIGIAYYPKNQWPSAIYHGFYGPQIVPGTYPKPQARVFPNPSNLVPYAPYTSSNNQAQQDFVYPPNILIEDDHAAVQWTPDMRTAVLPPPPPENLASKLVLQSLLVTPLNSKQTNQVFVVRSAQEPTVLLRNQKQVNDLKAQNFKVEIVKQKQDDNDWEYADNQDQDYEEGDEQQSDEDDEDYEDDQENEYNDDWQNKNQASDIQLGSTKDGDVGQSGNIRKVDASDFKNVPAK